MKQRVYILATVLRDNVDAALFTLKTFRVGFPSAELVVFGNCLPTRHLHTIKQSTEVCWGKFVQLPATCYDEWLETLVMGQKEPFWICDTDIYFRESVGGWEQPEVFSGTFQPEYFEPWSGTRYQERLHTCLMQINPVSVRAEIRRWNRQNIPATFHSGQIPFIRQTWIPQRNNVTLLYDTTAGLWNCGFGTPFTDKQLESFEHLHAATYSDEVSKHPELKDLHNVHKLIFEKPELAIGLRKVQDAFYKSHQ